MAVASSKAAIQPVVRMNRRRKRPDLTKEQELMRLPRHAADPPVRGEGRPDVRHGTDRRLLPPLYRPGGGGRRHADDAQARRPGDHRLSRPRPHAGLRHGRQGRHGRADRPPRRLFQGQRRLDAHVLRREGFLRRTRHRRRAGAARHRPRIRQPVPRQRQCEPHLFRRRRRQSGAGLRKLQHGEAMEAAGHLHHREQPVRHGHLGEPRVGDDQPVHARQRARHPRRAGRRHGRARGQGGGREGGQVVPRRQWPDHSRNADLPLSRPLDVGPGEISFEGRGRQVPHRARSDRAGARSG